MKNNVRDVSIAVQGGEPQWNMVDIMSSSYKHCSGVDS